MADSVEIGGTRAPFGKSRHARALVESNGSTHGAAGLYVPGVVDTGWWAGREAVRTPARFRDRVVAQFRSPQNLAYLRQLLGTRIPRGPLRRHALTTLHDAVLEFSSDSEGRALDVLLSDPLAQRGDLRPATGLWPEVRRLNRAFYEDRLALLRDQAHVIDPRAPRDGVSEDEEPYHMRMFIADSLRPPGLEHFNTPGPLYALNEDQSTWVPRPGGPSEGSSRETFRQKPRSTDPDVFLYNAEDAPWSIGDPNRTPEQAVAEYWGDGWTVTETATGAPETTGLAYGSLYSWSDGWQDNGGTRYMRYESPMFWQKGGREGYDYDIEENLGTQARELDNHVRRWDMDRVREPRGQEYRRYGPRTGHIV